MKTATVALGGNSLIRLDDEGTVSEQIQRMKKTCDKLTEMIKRGYELVLTHGNGPQVGNILLQNEISADKVPPMPLDLCVAQSQGQIGYLFQQILKNQLAENGIYRNISSLITQVQVDKKDPAFDNPSKFIGSTLSEKEVEEIIEEKGWDIKKTASGNYRRVVPSPEPKKIIESEIIEKLVFSGEKENIVIAVGGGGVPVLEENGYLRGVEAVIDKDKATAVLASQIDEKFLILLTDVERVYLNYSGENEEAINSIDVDEAQKYLDEGHFPPGSMGPKIESSIVFLKKGGEKVLITNPENLLEALDKKTGTYIYPSK